MPVHRPGTGEICKLLQIPPAGESCGSSSPALRTGPHPRPRCPGPPQRSDPAAPLTADPAREAPTHRPVDRRLPSRAGRPTPPTRRVVLLGVGHELARMRQRAGVVRPGHLPNIVTIIHCHLSAPATPPPLRSTRVTETARETPDRGTAIRSSVRPTGPHGALRSTPGVYPSGPSQPVPTYPTAPPSLPKYPLTAHPPIALYRRHQRRHPPIEPSPAPGCRPPQLLAKKLRCHLRRSTFPIFYEITPCCFAFLIFIFSASACFVITLRRCDIRGTLQCQSVPITVPIIDL